MPVYERGFAQPFGLTAVGSCKFREKMSGQNGYIFRALPEGRHGEWDYIEAIKEVFAKLSTGDFVL